LLAALYAAANQRAVSDQQARIFDADVLQWKEKAGTTPGSATNACAEHRYADCADVLRRQKLTTDKTRLTLGKALYTIHQYREAAEVLAQVSAGAKQNEESSYWLALSYRALGAECYAKLEEQFPESWRTHQLRGEGYALKQDLDNAIKEFQVALQMQPASSELHEALGEAYLNHHSDEDAQKELQKSLELNPSGTRSLYLLGKLYVQNRENDKALPYLQKALRLQPDLAEASSLLGTAYVRLGQFANAIPELEKAAPSDHYGNVHYELYLAYRKVGQSALAQKALARSQDLRRASLERDQALVMGSQQADDSIQ
jgi:tetratricopeptide (TPR) repeat protein